MHPGAGKNASHPRCDLVGHVAIRHADFRSVTLGSIPGGASGLRDGSRERIERRRVQTPDAGYRLDLRHLAAIHAIGGIWKVSLFLFMGARRGAPFFIVAKGAFYKLAICSTWNTSIAIIIRTLMCVSLCWAQIGRGCFPVGWKCRSRPKLG